MGLNRYRLNSPTWRFTIQLNIFFLNLSAYFETLVFSAWLCRIFSLKSLKTTQRGLGRFPSSLFKCLSVFRTRTTVLSWMTLHLVGNNTMEGREKFSKTSSLPEVCFKNDPTVHFWTVQLYQVIKEFERCHCIFREDGAILLEKLWVQF